MLEAPRTDAIYVNEMEGGESVTFSKQFRSALVFKHRSESDILDSMLFLDTRTGD